MPKLELDRVAVKSGALYPEPYAAMMAGRSSLRFSRRRAAPQCLTQMPLLMRPKLLRLCEPTPKGPLQ